MKKDERDNSDQPITRTDELRKKLHVMVDNATPEQIEKLNRFLTAFLG